jgi:hypothetical protein
MVLQVITVELDGLVGLPFLLQVTVFVFESLSYSSNVIPHGPIQNGMYAVEIPTPTDLSINIVLFF